MNQVFDKIRRRYVALTPEEQVRQRIIALLIDKQNISQSLISVEGQIKVAGKIKRYDILVYDHSLKPWIVIECKREEVVLNKETLDQIIRYNLYLQAPYIMITNSKQSFIFQLVPEKETQTSQIIQINSFPQMR
jgi:Type I site-specific restriction-modification system, R (restriction) subunit and related helicases